MNFPIKLSVDDKDLAIVALTIITVVAIIIGDSSEAVGIAEKVVIAIAGFVTGRKLDK